MDVSNISHEDGLRAGQLAQLLRSATWPGMNHEQATALTLASHWYHSICTKIAQGLPPGKEDKSGKDGAPAPGTFRVKSITPGKGGEPTKISSHSKKEKK